MTLSPEKTVDPVACLTLLNERTEARSASLRWTFSQIRTTPTGERDMTMSLGQAQHHA